MMDPVPTCDITLRISVYYEMWRRFGCWRNPASKKAASNLHAKLRCSEVTAVTIHTALLIILLCNTNNRMNQFTVEQMRSSAQL